MSRSPSEAYLSDVIIADRKRIADLERRGLITPTDAPYSEIVHWVIEIPVVGTYGPFTLSYGSRLVQVFARCRVAASAGTTTMAILRNTTTVGSAFSLATGSRGIKYMPLVAPQQATVDVDEWYLQLTAAGTNMRGLVVTARYR